MARQLFRSQLGQATYSSALGSEWELSRAAHRPPPCWWHPLPMGPNWLFSVWHKALRAGGSLPASPSALCPVGRERGQWSSSTSHRHQGEGCVVWRCLCSAESYGSSSAELSIIVSLREPRATDQACSRGFSGHGKAAALKILSVPHFPPLYPSAALNIRVPLSD